MILSIHRNLNAILYTGSRIFSDCGTIFRSPEVEVSMTFAVLISVQAGNSRILQIFFGLSSSSWCYPNSWMVYFMENPMKMENDWGYPHGLETSGYLPWSLVIGVMFTNLAVWGGLPRNYPQTLDFSDLRTAILRRLWLSLPKVDSYDSFHPTQQWKTTIPT